MDGTPLSKTMDRDDLTRPACRLILSELFGLMRRMQSQSAAYSSWYGKLDGWPSLWERANRGEGYAPWPGNPDEARVPWFLLWEIAWLAAHTPVRPGARVLDMGGAGSLFSCYLASRGIEVHAIDLDESLCRQARETARRMGWRLLARRMDMTRLDYPDGFFSHVFSVCVFEHLPISGRVACNREVCRVLAPGGTASYTFDYANPQSFGRLDTPEDVHRQLVEPSGLQPRGSREFWDCGKRYLQTPQCAGFSRFTRLAATAQAFVTRSVDRRRLAEGTTSYTFGALFLRKPDGRAAGEVAGGAREGSAERRPKGERRRAG
ncbi:MAG: class I SAM-dependent methyltransferase [Phycisphaerae bacterium]